MPTQRVEYVAADQGCEKSGVVGLIVVAEVIGLGLLLKRDDTLVAPIEVKRKVFLSLLE